MTHAGMTWDCKEKGCYKELCVPDLTVFMDCFGRNICPTDIDGLVECKRHFLLMEWKAHTFKVSTGQDRMLRALTSIRQYEDQKPYRFIAIVIFGQANPVEVTAWQPYKFGEPQPAVVGPLEALKDEVRAWYRWADKRFADEHEAVAASKAGDRDAVSDYVMGRR